MFATIQRLIEQETSLGKVAFPLSAMRRDTLSSIVSISLAVLSLWQADMDSREAA